MLLTSIYKSDLNECFGRETDPAKKLEMVLTSPILIKFGANFVIRNFRLEIYSCARTSLTKGQVLFPFFHQSLFENTEI